MLQRFGFTQYESKVYESLLSSHELMDATMIVKYSGVPKAKVYEVLTRMIEKGMILDSVSERKKYYSALPLQLAIDKLTAEFKLSIDQLKTNTYEKQYTDDRVWSLKVDSSIKMQCRQLLQDANKSIRITVWNDDFNDFAVILEEKEKKGVNVEALVVGDVQSSLTNLQILSPKEEHKALEQNRLLIIDDEEILFAGVENNAWQAMKTKSKPFVKFFTEFFYHDVALTKITKKYEDILMEDDEIKSILLQLRY
jgi:HTH-type transcriptional regulator, sugar sensing transcriptional regulator